MADSSYIAPEANMAPSSSPETGFSVGRTALAGPTGESFGQYQIQISRSPSTEYDPTGDGIVEYSPSEDEEEEADVDSSSLYEKELFAASPSSAGSTPPTEHTASSEFTTPVKKTAIKSTPPSSPPTKVKLELKGTPPAQTQQSKKRYLTASPHRSLKSTSSKPILVDFHPRNSSLEQIQALRARLDMGEELVYKTQNTIDAQLGDLKDEVRKTNFETKKRQDKLEDQQDQLEEKQEVTDSRSARNERRLAEVEITIEDVIGKPPNLPGLFPPGHSSYFSGPTSPSRLPGAWGPRSSRSSRTSRTGSAAPIPSIEMSDAVKHAMPTLGGRSSCIVDTASPPDLSPSIGSKRKSAELESDDKDAEARGAKKQKKKISANTTKTAPKKTTTPPQSLKRKAEEDLEADDKDTGKKDSDDEDTQPSDNRPAMMTPAMMTVMIPLCGYEPRNPPHLPKKTDTAPKGQKRKAEEEFEEGGKDEGKKNRDDESGKRPIKKVKTAKKSGDEPKQTVTTSKKTTTKPKGQKRKAEEEVGEDGKDEGEKIGDDEPGKRPIKKARTGKKSGTKPKQTATTSKKTTTKLKGPKSKAEKAPKENDKKMEKEDTKEDTKKDAKEDIKEAEAKPEAEEKKPVKAPKKKTAKPVKPAVPGTRTGLRSQKKQAAAPARHSPRLLHLLAFLFTVSLSSDPTCNVLKIFACVQDSVFLLNIGDVVVSVTGLLRSHGPVPIPAHET
ncbi:uncharacterized protein BDZ83DRAFT_656337 [Colletotrichum acutatum]|uniref:Uncharacterized protein n=1 Tax=Glomerella acutata TaxID=27357 RepID=A0AAD8UE23_GLOAC|nr:uncharacterized protein BDZ83DRAFT_656337 [Colletotrichum acutatum]KAK1713363.1 hypothetical protein BDZ83DRAFT_656337 [Colletotrichum acutatum]